MSKDPAILLYTSDFLTQCNSLTMEERGQYITLICLQHQIGHLDSKTIDITIGYDNLSSDVLKLYKQDASGYLFNEWIEEIIIKRKAYAESRRKNRKGKRKKQEIEDSC